MEDRDFRRGFGGASACGKRTILLSSFLLSSSVTVVVIVISLDFANPPALPFALADFKRSVDLSISFSIRLCFQEPSTISNRGPMVFRK